MKFIVGDTTRAP